MPAGSWLQGVDKKVHPTQQETFPVHASSAGSALYAGGPTSAPMYTQHSTQCALFGFVVVLSFSVLFLIFHTTSHYLAQR